MNPSKALSQDEDLRNVPQELIDLGRAIAELPVEISPRLADAYDRVVQGVQRRKRILRMIQDSISQLRLDVKYLVFDLEMTRRERDELRERVEEDI